MALRQEELGIMQSYREQSNYHGNPPTYPPESHGAPRLEELSPRQQAHIFQGGYGGRRSGTATPTAIAPGENPSLQNYQSYRKESGDIYYLGSKEAGTPGGQTQQRRLPGPVQSYGPPQGNSSTSSTGYSSPYGRESHPSQFAGQHSSSASLSQYSQDFPGSFSPGSGQYSSHVASQQLRHQLYQSHQPISPAGNPPASTGTSHLQQIQRSANLNSPGYALRMGQFAQHYQASQGSSSSSYPQRFGQSGANYEGYSPGGTSSPYESHMSGSSYGTQQAYSSFTSQHLKNFETAKMPQGGSQGQQQSASPLMQFPNSSKLLTQNQLGQYNQSEVPVRSPMQFQQNFSPISNPSPAPSVVQSPTCSSTPSPLMTSSENIQCGQGNVPLQSRNRILPVMPQLSPNAQITSFKGFGVEGPTEKHVTDPGLSSLSALSSQVANLPNTVQHMLLSDALATHKKGGKRTSRKTDSCANSETSSQAEEQLKSPMAESLDGSCSSSSGDPGERVRQLSGQSTSSEAGYKGPPSEMPPSPAHTWQNEPSGKTTVQDVDTVPEPAKSYPEISKASEKAVGVIVSTETVTNRSEKLVDEAPTVANNNEEEEEEDDDDDPSPEPEQSEITKEEDTETCLNPQNGEPITVDASSSTGVNEPLIETDKSPVGAGFGFKEAPSISRNTSSLAQQPKNSDAGTFGGQSDRKTGRNDKYPSLLQEFLQGHHQQERRYVRNAQEQPPVTESPDVPLRPNVLMSQANEQPNRSMPEKTLTPQLESTHWGQWDRKHTSEIKHINLAEYPNTRKYEGEPPAPCHEPISGPSERRSVICDISPLRQLMRDPASSHHIDSTQERSQDGRAGQSVILPSGMLSLEKSSSQSGIAKAEDTDSTKMIRRRTVEQCIPYGSKDSPRGNASPRSMTFDSNQEYSSHGRSTNPKRGPGRVGSRGRSPAQSHDLGDKLKSLGRSRGATDIHHVTPTMSLSERASREALYSAFFQNADASALAYHTNSRSSSYGEPHPSFTSSLHYKRQMYQQEEYKEWLGSTAQAILSASHHRQELQRKSPRQESFHVRSPGRSENEGLPYSQPTSYHDPSNIDFSRQMRMSEGTSTTLTAGDFKQNSQKTPPGDSTGWHLGRQSLPAKKSGSLASANQKPFSSIRDHETHGPRQVEPTEFSKSGCNAHRPSGPEDSSHHNPLIMRRKVRSFISPIPSKRQLPDDKAHVIASSKEACDRTLASHNRSPRGNENELLSTAEEQSKSGPEQRSPTAVTLSSPTKTKILPPRKGRGLKLEAIVQKITSPNVRRTTTPSNTDIVVEPVTLEDILSLKGRPSEACSSTIEETTERTVDAVPDTNKNFLNIKRLSPKSFEAWPANNDKQIKIEIEEQFMETKDLPQSGPSIQQASNHYLETGENSPALEQKSEQKSSEPQPPPRETPDKEKVVTAPCPVTPKQTIIPPKGYFPSGKKRGRPIGSVSKQKKQQLQQQQLQQQQQNVHQQVQDQQQLQPPIATDLTPLPQQTQSISQQEIEAEPKPKRRRRERRKQPGTTRRRRGKQAAPIVAPIEPEIKLKYASQILDKTETKPKSFFPYIHVENKEELGLACVIINAEEEEQRWRKETSARKEQRSTSPQPSERKALPASSFMVLGPAVTESASVGHLVCCFCGKWANYKNFGDLFGPFYTQEYASTLSKNPPPKKSSETPQKVKVRHKDTLDGSKSDSDEEEELPQQAREQRSLSAHLRYKRRNRSGDCTSRLAVPSHRKTTDSSELLSLDSSGSVNADGVPDQGFQIPQLPLDSNEFWMHEACVLWANGVYFVCGRLYGLQEACDVAKEMICAHCQEPGATLGCFNKGCVCCYHFPCAMDSECLLNEENFSVRCPKHKTKTIKGVSAEQPEQG
ncbi:transcription factor 20-like isoform X2 [Hyla sarda]|uniref:transcription factor 20-like isoform X2 n=1 Tax=Hyla sarda TaxID=327740 RepID=UPI0024C3E8E1|nr:transcription factor 20-like isoform X2 [Hyla sarda]